MAESKPSDAVEARGYDRASLEYLARNSKQLNALAGELHVQASSIAAGIAREMSRTPYMTWGQSIGKLVGIMDQEVTRTNKDLINEYDAAQKTLFGDGTPANPGNPHAFDHQTAWDPKRPTQINAMLLDLGPGHIRTLTALQLLNKYGSDPAFKALGLGEYINMEHGKPVKRDGSIYNFRQFVYDLNNGNKDLSLKIAALVAHDAQQHFTKNQNGIQFMQANKLTWDTASQEQRDILTSSYYTRGQAAVDSAIKNEKRPYSPFTDAADTGARFVQFPENECRLQYAVMSPSGRITRAPSAEFELKVFKDQNGLTVISSYQGGNLIRAMTSNGKDTLIESYENGRTHQTICLDSTGQLTSASALSAGEGDALHKQLQQGLGDQAAAEREEEDIRRMMRMTPR